MADKKEQDLESNWVRITMGYTMIVLPWDEGMTLFKTLQEVQFVERVYAGNQGWKRTAEKEISLTVFTPTEQAQLLMEKQP
jgi:hypothetical protein